MGTTSYPLPPNAIYVAPDGSDGASGTRSAPLRTVAKAISKAPGGSTIVLRAGVYHEKVLIPPGKRLTIQSYPKEAVWFDGSVRVTGFTESGSVWKVSGWTAKFDSSPTYTRGAPDNSAVNWKFVNPAHPMAAHPDQVWINNVPQVQVSSLSQVKPGTFYVDYATSQLYLGSDPRGQDVRASTLNQAIMVVSDGSVLRGFGVRRYADSIPDFGAVSVRRPNVMVENVDVEDSATIGVSVSAVSGTLRHITVNGSGFLGVHAHHADGLTVDASVVSNSNTEHFNMAPVAGGMKVSSTRGILIRDSRFLNNEGNALWFDVSDYDMTIVGNDFVGNMKHGLVMEISSTGTVVDNVMANNAWSGFLDLDTSNVRVWNNTLVGNGQYQIEIVQDKRTPATSYGRDSRRPYPDPTMTWRTGPVDIYNNVMAAATADVTAMVDVLDKTKTRTPAQMGVHLDGNVYLLPARSHPAIASWGRASSGRYALYADLKAFRSASGEDANSQAISDSGALSDRYVLTGDAAGRALKVARPLPAQLANLVDRPVGSTHAGAWR